VLAATRSNTPDRRRSPRFPIVEAIHYRSLEISGAGRTIDIGTQGVLFTTEHWLEPGQIVEVVMDWPVARAETPLELEAAGRLVRSEPGLAVLEIARYEFRPRRARR
jgi:hypothetical protein